METCRPQGAGRGRADEPGAAPGAGKSHMLSEGRVGGHQAGSAGAGGPTVPRARPWAQGEWGKTVQFCFVKIPGAAGHWVGLPAVGSGVWISGELEDVSAFILA